MYEVAKEGYLKYGSKFFYTGIGPCALMAFPVHVIIIIVYEYLTKLSNADKP